MVVPQGRQRRPHPGDGPRRAVLRRRDPLRLGGRHVMSRTAAPSASRCATGRAARRPWWSARSTRGTRSSTWSTRASCPPTWSRTCAATVPGHGVQGQLRARRPAEVPGTRRPHRHVPRLRQRRAVDGVPRACVRRGEVRLVLEKPYLDACFQSVLDPDMAPPGKHVIPASRVHAVRAAGADWEPSATTSATPSSDASRQIFPGLPDLVLQREVVTPLDIETVTPD